MSTPRTRASGFFGPAESGLDQEIRRLRPGPFRKRTVRLPRSVRGELASHASAMKRAADGDVAAAVSKVKHTLLHRTTLGPTAADYERIAAIGYDAYLQEQLDYEQLDDSELEESLAADLPTLTMSATALYNEYRDNPFIPVLELWIASVYRALYSPRQLYERMVIFWSDHFSIDIFAQPQPVLKPIDDRDVVRANALGSFPELLSASAHSPAMLVFLTNDTNVQGHANENYARELMELHTMGEDNGYDEQDVKEVARCFTGWSWSSGFRDAGLPGTFQFRSRDHDAGKKKVLGKTIKAGGGIEDGERVLEILLDKKQTREFIAGKMLRWLWGYEPKKNAIKKVARAYSKSDGDIREMLREVLSSKRLGSATTKLKRPFHLTTSTLRAMAAEVTDTRFVLQALREAGHLPYDWGPPNGYPDSIDYWSGFVLPRWNFAAELFDQRGLSWDPSLDDPGGSVASIVDRLDQTFLAGNMSPATRVQIEGYLEARTLSRQRVRGAIGLTISSPDFQEY